MSGDSRPLRVLHLTDPHLFAQADGELRGVVTTSSLEQTLADYRGSGWVADLALVTGDIGQDHTAGAYRRFRDLLGKLGIPVHCVPGNHDVPALLRPECAPPVFHYCAAVDCGDWLIVGLDSSLPDKVGGALPAAELARLSAAIERSKAGHVLVHLHHPPVPVGARWLDAVGLADGARAIAELAASGRVRGLVFGHVHMPYDETHNGIRIVGTPSTCRQFLPGSDEFAVDDRPPAWRRLELGADGRIDTQLVWIDAN